MRIVSTRSLVEMLKATVKVVCLCWLVYGEYMGLLDTFPKMMLMDIRKSFPQVMLVSFRIAIKMGAVLIAIAALDYFYQWWRYEKDLRMTKQEVKEEYKQLEGDPQIKSRIRRIQRQMSRMRMMPAYRKRTS
jgi:flagellar biosynthetic protein FlhB